MTKLSVNINKAASLRNARGGNNPNLVQFAMDCESFGADGITVHPRPDQRHIRYSDVKELKPIISTELNIEGYPSKEFMDLVGKIRPEQCTLVPDSPEVLTSNQGWDVKKNQSFLAEVVTDLKKQGIRVSLFLDPIPERASLAGTLGVDRIELYTESYATKLANGDLSGINDYVRTAERARKEGLEINAGHDLDRNNLAFMIEKIPFISEVSIGHALICDALYYGIENTIQMYKRQLRIGANRALRL